MLGQALQVSDLKAERAIGQERCARRLSVNQRNGAGWKAGKGSSSLHLLFMAPGVFVSASLGASASRLSQDSLDSDCWSAEMLNCQKRVAGCASLKNQLELIVLQLLT